jgi:hypothetical protein
MKTCERCGEAFTPPYPRTNKKWAAQRFCSLTCSARANAKTRRPPTTVPLEERFWAKVDKAGECWEWGGYISEYGYGQVGVNGRIAKAHRVAYELGVGPIPEGLTIDHLCRNRSCVNPAHLEAVTLRENILRGEAMGARYARRTHCANGHLLGEFRGDRRDCKQCDRERHARNKVLAKEAA